MTVFNSIIFPAVWFSEKRLRQATRHKTILITGATFGIGEALANSLANASVTLVLVARTSQKLAELQTELSASGATIILVALDLTDKVAVADWLADFDIPIDILVNNAGKSIRRPLYQSLDRLHDFERTMALNYFAPVQLFLHFAPQIEQRKGQLITISAVNVLLPPAPYWAAYQASKSALDQWWRSAAPELNTRGITTTSIYLPLVRTRMIAPTKIYDKVPAMSPQRAARIIAKTMYTQAYQYRPWWLPFGQWFGFIFGRLWHWINVQLLQLKLKRTKHSK